MGLGEVAVSGFNRFAGGLKWAGDSAYGFEAIKKTSDFVRRYIGFYIKQMAENQGTFFIRPVILMSTAIKYFELTGVPKGLKRFLSHSLVTKSHLQSIGILTQLPKVIAVLSTEIVGSPNDPKAGIDYARELVITKTVVKKGGSPGEPQTELVEEFVKLSLTPGEKLAKKMASIAYYFISCSDAFNEWKECQKVSPLLTRMVPWVQTASGFYMGVQGLFEEGQIFYRDIYSADNGDGDKSVSWIEKRYSLMNMAVSASYIACSICGGLKIWFADQASKSLKRYHFVSLAALVVLPIAQAYLKRAVDELHTAAVKKNHEIRF